MAVVVGGRERGCGGVTGPVHFIYLGGPWHWQYDRAIQTAMDVHDAPVIVWSAQGPVPFLNSDVVQEVRSLDLPDWLRDHPIQLANVKDLYAWRILHQHGGLYLDLDTISLQPVWDLLTRDVLVSYELEPPEYVNEHPYNSAVVAARQGAPVLAEMAEMALRILAADVKQWGSCGPRLLTQFVADQPDRFDIAPLGVLNGWRDGTIRRYYNGERPGPEVRVVHLFSSSNMRRFLKDTWTPEKVAA